MSENLQKHWDFRKCAGLRRVVSLSSMRVRAWKTTKVPSATRRTRCNRCLLATQCSSPVRSPNETLRTVGCSHVIDLSFGMDALRLSITFHPCTTLPHVARSLPSRPTHRPPHSMRQWANGGPTSRLPEWYSVASCDEIASPQRMGPPPEFDASLGCGNSRASQYSLFVLSGRLSPPFSQGDLHELGYSLATGIEAIQRSWQTRDCQARSGRGDFSRSHPSANDME